jgi:hypothetical protein
MPRDLLSFVRDRNVVQSQPNPPTTKYLENRRAIAEGAKIKPKTALGQTLQEIPQYRLLRLLIPYQSTLSQYSPDNIMIQGS